MHSEICIHDLARGETRTLLSTDTHVEAPNWHPEGYLIVNGEGRLFRVPLDAPALLPIDTGPLTRLNNDHGLSPDGLTLALSNHTVPGKSCIYLLPLAGGDPVQVTAETPSWWHSWSPDGTRLAYVAVRRAGGPVSLYTCRTDGTDETCVTEAFDHVDGPDYAPDGAFLWFNGERDGRVDLWRIRPDGTGLERMTSGETVDWFPHPSPCGRHVVFLAYPPGTQGHPAGLDVALHLMPQSGGPPRELLRLHGGQGTINVPSWAPDGGAFAFVRYRPA